MYVEVGLQAQGHKLKVAKKSILCVLEIGVRKRNTYNQSQYQLSDFTNKTIFFAIKGNT